MRRCVVYCGSSFGSNPEYRRAAAELGRLLAQRGVALVYGGGNVGLMGVVADACLEAAGTVVGVIPQFMTELELAHKGLQELHVVGDMHERKARMLEEGDAFIALPGGVGTLEEVLEAMAWTAAGHHGKPVGLLNLDGMYSPLLRMLHNGIEACCVPESCMRSFAVSDSVEDLLTQLQRMPSDTTVRPTRWLALPDSQAIASGTCCAVLVDGSQAPPTFMSAARQLGERLGAGGAAVLFPGAQGGMATALAEAAVTAGGAAVAITEEDSELSPGTDPAAVHPHVWKRRLFARAGKFLVAPGGLAVWEHLLEVLSSAQLGGHRRPIGLLSTRGYYSPLRELIQKTVECGFAQPQILTYIFHAETPQALLDGLDAHRPTWVVKKALDRPRAKF